MPNLITLQIKRFHDQEHWRSCFAIDDFIFLLDSIPLMDTQICYQSDPYNFLLLCNTTGDVSSFPTPNQDTNDIGVGLVVMAYDSCSRVCGFKSRHRILDGHEIFSQWYVAKIVLFKKTENKQKEAGVGSLKNRYRGCHSFICVHDQKTSET